MEGKKRGGEGGRNRVQSGDRGIEDVLHMKASSLLKVPFVQENICLYSVYLSGAKTWNLAAFCVSSSLSRVIHGL